MSLACPQCGHLNALSTIYCESCGTTLSAALATPSDANAETSPSAVTDLDSQSAGPVSPPSYPTASPTFAPSPPNQMASSAPPPPAYGAPPNQGYGTGWAPHVPGKVRMEWWGDAVNLLCQDPGGWLMTMLPSVLIAFVVVVAAYILALCTFGLGVILIIGIGGAFSAAFGAMLVKLRTGTAPDFNAIMRESSVQFFPGMVLCLLGFLAMSIGTCFCVLPCFFVCSVWVLAHCDMGAGEQDPFRAFGRAWNVCMTDPVGWLIFGLVYNIACMFMLTIPVAYLAPVLAYRDSYGDN